MKEREGGERERERERERKRETQFSWQHENMTVHSDMCLGLQSAYGQGTLICVSASFQVGLFTLSPNLPKWGRICY